MSAQQVEQELIRCDQNIRPNHIVLLTVLNALYPIDVQIIAKVCQPMGKIIRIVVFKRGAIVQAMVEYDDVGAATNAKSQLHGCDIYSGSCTLKVEFAKTDRLNVKRNDEMTWDYTEEFALRQGFREQQSPMTEPAPPGDKRDRPVLLQEAPPGGMINPGFGGPMGGGGGGWGGDMGGGHGGNFGGAGRGGYGGAPHRSEFGDGGRDPGHNYVEPDFGNTYGGGAGGGGGRRGGAVVMMYGMEPDKFNCQRVFNIFCQYGNVNRVMFLKNKEGTAMVEMDCPDSVNKAIANLNHTAIFGLKLRLDWSKKDFIDDVRNPHQLLDGTMSYHDFSRDRNNRFDTQERAAKNRIIAPTKILHFYNVPKMEDQEMEDIFTRGSGPPPNKIKWFPAKSDKSVSGLCEWDSVQEACEAIVLANHTEIEGTNKKYPYCMKLCFSPATH